MRLSRSSFHSGLLYAILAALLFSFKPILIKLIYAYEVDSLVLITWRMILSMPVYVLIGLGLWQRAEPSQKARYRQGWLKAALVGFIGYYLAALFDLLGLQFVSAQLERLVLFTYPTLVAVLAWLLFGKRITSNTMLALVISYLGVGLIFIQDWQSGGSQVLLGSGLVFLAALAFAIYVLLSKPIIDLMGSLAFTVVAMVSSSIYIFISFWVMRDFSQLAVPVEVWWNIVLMSLVSTVIPTFLIAAAIQKLGPEKTAISGTIGPIATAIFAVILLGEHFSWMHAIGLVLVVLAVFVMQRKQVEKPL